MNYKYAHFALDFIEFCKAYVSGRIRRMDFIRYIHLIFVIFINFYKNLKTTIENAIIFINKSHVKTHFL